MLDAILFYLFAVLALGGALLVVGQRNPTYSALALIVTLCSLSAIFGLLGSPFIAVLQVVVYAGAIMVLFLFVIMLLNAQAEPEPQVPRRLLKRVGSLLALFLLVEVGAILAKGQALSLRPLSPSIQNMARVLFSEGYLYVFEATSVLILAALVGAVTLAKKDL